MHIDLSLYQIRFGNYYPENVVLWSLGKILHRVSTQNLDFLLMRLVNQNLQYITA